MRLYNAVGTTSIYEGHGSSPETISCYRQLAEEGGLSVRTSLAVSPTWENMHEADRAMRDWLSYAKGRGLGNESGRAGPRRASLPCSGHQEQGLEVRHLGPLLDHLALDREVRELLHFLEHARIRRRRAELHLAPQSAPPAAQSRVPWWRVP